MRPLRFRAWDATTKKMWFPRAIAADGRNTALVNQFGVETEDSQGDVLMQFTGLRDRQGTEIYEGDVVRLDGTKDYARCKPPVPKSQTVGTFVVEVEQGPWGFEFNWRNLKGYSCSTHIMGEATEDGTMPNAEILGNIYSHPHLLEARP